MISHLSACMAQGMRCGHIDGKARCGVYVRGEELLIDVSDHMADRRSPAAVEAFSNGYAYGYRLGASGEALPDDIVNAPLPEECSS